MVSNNLFCDKVLLKIVEQRKARHTHAKKFFLEKSLKVSLFDPNMMLSHDIQHFSRMRLL